MVDTYVTATQVKTRLKISVATYDTEIDLAIGSASREIDDWCGRRFDQTAAGVVRTFAPRDLTLLAVTDVVSVTAVKTDTGTRTFATTLTSSQYKLLPVDAAYAADARPYTSIRAIGTTWPFPTWPGEHDDTVQVTGTWGWPAVPRPVAMACLILASETLKLSDAPFGVVGMGEFGAIRVRDNPKVKALLGPYRRQSVLVG